MIFSKPDSSNISNTQMNEQEQIISNAKGAVVPIKENINPGNIFPTFDFSEMIWHDGLIGSYPTEECVQLMEQVFMHGGTIEDVCKFVGIDYKTYKNWMNRGRKFSSNYTKGQQADMIRRLERAKICCRMSCKMNLMEMSKTNFKALKMLFDITENIRRKEDDRRDWEGY